MNVGSKMMTRQKRVASTERAKPVAASGRSWTVDVGHREILMKPHKSVTSSAIGAAVVGHTEKISRLFTTGNSFR